MIIEGSNESDHLIIKYKNKIQKYSEFDSLQQFQISYIIDIQTFLIG